MKIRYPLAYLSAIIVSALLLSWRTDPPAAEWIAPPAAVAGSFLPLPDITGAWFGTWADTVYQVGGLMTFSIARDGDSWFANGTIDVTSISPTLGTLSGSATGTSTASPLSGTFTCTNLGSGTVAIMAPPGFGDLATASGSGTVGSPLDFGPFTFSGTVVADGMVGGFDFTNPGGGKGIAALVKIVDPVAPTTWSAVKSKYGG
jgi:hypothetical protein